jgi:hypothetical protein
MHRQQESIHEVKITLMCLKSKGMYLKGCIEIYYVQIDPVKVKVSFVYDHILDQI